jgi:putative glutamine amidotransferase
MHKPVIGITANSLFSENGAFPGMERVYVNQSYLHSVEKAGGIPVLLPTVSSDSDITEQLGRVDGVILSGGCDINPLLFGEEPVTKLEFVLADRDEYEIALTRLSYQSGKPLLGICRGIQVLNVAFGGSLYQDIHSQAANCCLKHSQSSRRDFAGHTVDIMPGSLLHDIIGKTALPVNSFHHQAVKDVAHDFITTARARDGIIEAIEKPGKRFLLGVQWHPEMLVDSYPVMLELFKRLVGEAKKGIR